MIESIGMPDIRRHGAQQLMALIIGCLEDHFNRYPPDVAYGRISRFYRELEHELQTKGYMVLSDDVRARVGMAPVGPEGWTKQELLIYEAARQAILMQPVMMVESVVFEVDEPPPGFVLYTAPEPKEPK